MILDEIVLQNFGLYAGRQTLILTPPSAAKPVVLIGGLNGGGKTTLLDALQLGLYGPHARMSNRGSIAYSEYLMRCIHRGATGAAAAVEIAFRHTVEGKEDQYRIQRSWRLNGTICKESFEVFRNGRPEPALAESWITQVEDLLPPNIAHLFLFDGEQIESYASLSNSSALIGAAIQNLLGLDVVDQLDKDLQVFERRKRSEDKESDVRQAIDAAIAERDALQARTTILTQERAALRTHKIDQQRKALAKLEEQFRKLGGELYEQRADIERKKEAVAEECAQKTEALRELAAGPLPFSLVGNLLKSVAARDESETKSRHAREVAKALKQRDRDLVAHFQKKFDKATLAALQAFLNSDREKRDQVGKVLANLDLSADARGDLHNLLREGLADAVKAGIASVEQLKAADVRAEKLRSQFESIPGADTIRDVAARRDALRQEIAELESDYATMGSEIERIFKEIERKNQALSRLLEGETKAEGEKQDRVRTIHHSARVRETLSAFRRAVTERHVRCIEQLVFESYKQLLRKATLITRLTIDSETYSLTLYGRDESVLSAERLSAGERQLLAIALLWGLAKASGRPLPTAIDTPLGRLDTEHRNHLIERYFPFASHQVLLLSTDEEITGDYFRRLEPWIGRTYRLDYDDDRGETRIREGYFGTRAAA